MVRTNLRHEKFYNHYKIYTRNVLKISKATLYIVALITSLGM